ncbi:hypothetical protein [Corynebacterium canis]|nr:hypothetical protein [Corynebacterium canis]
MTKQNTNALYRWANTSKCSTDEIVVLANDIETAGYTHHCR